MRIRNERTFENQGLPESFIKKDYGFLHVSTPPCPLHVPERVLLKEKVPSLQRAEESWGQVIEDVWVKVGEGLGLGVVNVGELMVGVGVGFFVTEFELGVLGFVMGVGVDNL